MKNKLILILLLVISILCLVSCNEEKEDDFYVGYTENYIRCYIKSDEDIIGQIVEVKIKKLYKDGAIAKQVQHKK